jgi:hypothetical protein
MTRILSVLIITAALSACAKPFAPAALPGSGAASLGRTLSWKANREGAVNSPGGGYRVHYSADADFDPASPFIDVKYSPAGGTPHAASLSGLAPGRYFITVVAYSLATPEGSAPSETVAVEII